MKDGICIWLMCFTGSKMKSILLAELLREVELLERWVSETKSGGWSTHLVQPMEDRIKELKVLLFDMGLGR